MPPANTTAITATTISSTAYNTLETDIGTELTNSLDRLGRSAMQANLPMGGNKITGMADPTVTTDAATKNYTDALVSTFFSTGDVKMTLKSVADTGWLIFDDGTFGSASSGSSNRANADTLALFTLLFNSPFVDANIAIFTSGGGATTRAAQVSASAAWAANCRMSLPKTLGRALALAGSGSGLSTWALGQNFGSQAVALTTANLPATIYNLTSGVGTSTSSSFVSTPSGTTIGMTANQSAPNPGIGYGFTAATFAGAVSSTVTGTIGPLGSASPITTIQPTVYLNAMVKL